MSDYDSSGTESSDDWPCPWDGCDHIASTEMGVKIHHGKKHGESIAGVPVQCEWCGETNRVKQNIAEKDKRHFCDQECMGKWRSEHWTGEDSPRWDGGKRTYHCEYCGKVQERHPSTVRESGRVFCDRECQSEWQSENLIGENAVAWQGGSIEVDCTNCGGPTFVKRARYEEGERYFCSRECCNKWQAAVAGPSNPLWANGNPRYGYGFTDTKKERIRDRQDRRCAGCGIYEAELRRKLDVHHIQKAGAFETDEARNDESNLVALCENCHKQWELLSPLRPQTPYLD